VIAEEVAAHPWVARAAECVRFGISTAPQHDWDATKAFAQAVEAMGFDALMLPEHPMFVGNATWTALCGLAEVTHTVRLGTLVSCVSYSNPAVLARMAADLDRMSGGRAILGLGSGDMPHEFRQLGVPWRPAAERQAALEEGLQIIRPLLQGRRVTFRGQYFHVEDAVLEPPPMQQPGVPILVAGGGEKTTLRFAASYADGVNVGAASWAGGAFGPEDIRRKFDVLDQHCLAAERAPSSVMKTAIAALVLGTSPESAVAKLENVPAALLTFFERLPIIGTPEQAAARVRAMIDTGFQYVIFIVLDRESLELAAEQVIPAVVAT
jgi:alkanesulfonate monooxygenase SsuD/methylene tetrahydromethanopterin reductase-like flavin-dependent oxidoreductase (luciferase family)